VLTPLEPEPELTPLDAPVVAPEPLVPLVLAVPVEAPAEPPVPLVEPVAEPVPPLVPPVLAPVPPVPEEPLPLELDVPDVEPVPPLGLPLVAEGVFEEQPAKRPKVTMELKRERERALSIWTPMAESGR
jgi:hypothetical protein